MSALVVCHFIGLCSYGKPTGSQRAFLQGCRLVLQISLEVPLKTQASWTGRRLGLAGCVKHGLTVFTPGGGVKLEGEDDVTGMTHLADEAPLGAKVTVVDVVGGKLDQNVQVGHKIGRAHV